MPDYKTHPYMECPLPNGKILNVEKGDKYNHDCNECEQYYLEEIHPDFCETDCICKRV